MVQDADILTLMPTWSRLQLRLNALIKEIFPCSTYELLPEWEATLGLPDPCTGPLSTIAQRVAAVCAKFAARGGQSKNYYEQIAESLGIQISITEFAPFRVGINRAGDPLNSEAWAFAWEITSDQFNMIYFRTGVSVTRDPLREWGNQLLADGTPNGRQMWLDQNGSLTVQGSNAGFLFSDRGGRSPPASSRDQPPRPR